MTYLSVKEAAEIAGKNERTIRRWIKANKIKSSKIRGRFHVDEDSLDEVIEKKGKRKKEKVSKITKIIEQSGSPISERDNTSDSRMTNIEETGSHSEQTNKMSGRTENDRVENVRTLHIVSDKIREYIKLLEIQNSKYKSQISNLKFQTVQDTRNKTQETRKSRGIEYKLHKNLPTHSTDKNFIKEGEEYVLNGKERGQNMSGHDEFNMSVNKLSDNPITSQQALNNDVEMSVLTELDMSDSPHSPINAPLGSMSEGDMSDFFGQLSTNLDMSVDKSFDGHGMIDTENPFSGDTNKLSGQKVGHNNRTVELSAYASRLIDEKERVAIKFEEQNDFLKNELSELRKEVSALRGVVAGESINRTNTSEFLMRMNESLQKNNADLYAKVEEASKNNSELLITSTKLNQIQPNTEESIGKSSHNSLNTSDILELKKIESNILNAIDMEKPDKKSPDITDVHKMFLLGFGTGMIFGLMSVSLIVFLIIYLAN